MSTTIGTPVFVRNLDVLRPEDRVELEQLGVRHDPAAPAITNQDIAEIRASIPRAPDAGVPARPTDANEALRPSGGGGGGAAGSWWAQLWQARNDALSGVGAWFGGVQARVQHGVEDAVMDAPLNPSRAVIDGLAGDPAAAEHFADEQVPRLNEWAQSVEASPVYQTATEWGAWVGDVTGMNAAIEELFAPLYQ